MKKSKEDRRHLNPGRPKVASRKKTFQVMLDPRYIAHFKKVAVSKGTTPQALASLAMKALVPDPYAVELTPQDLLTPAKSRRKT